MRLVQLLGDGIEELWNFSEGTTDEKIKEWYTAWMYYEDPEEKEPLTFDEWMDKFHDQVYCERVFVDEIYV